MLCCHNQVAASSSNDSGGAEQPMLHNRKTSPRSRRMDVARKDARRLQKASLGKLHLEQAKQSRHAPLVWASASSLCC